MLNRDKRSKVLSLCFGDGCLHYIKTNGKLFGGLTIDHGLPQLDYLTWKSVLLQEITGRKVAVRPGHRGNSAQISVCMKRFRCWRKFFYPNGKKDISLFLPFITDVDFLLAVWFMDDGNVSTNLHNDKVSSVNLRLFTNSETMACHSRLLDWFNSIGIQPRIKYMLRPTGNKEPYLQFNLYDSFSIWTRIRLQALQHPSMQHKFRHIETLYTSRFLQPPLSGLIAAQ